MDKNIKFIKKCEEKLEEMNKLFFDIENYISPVDKFFFRKYKKKGIIYSYFFVL